MSFAVTKDLCQAANVLHSHVRVTLAPSHVQSILEIPVTDEIHMDDRNHGRKAEQRHIQQTCASTVAFESTGTKRRSQVTDIS